MIPKICIHPNKANQLIKDFTFKAVNLPFSIKMVKSNRVEYFIEGSIENKNLKILVPNWKKVDFTKDDCGKAFRKDFVTRCSLARGFSDVTLSLLHEIGHAMTKTFVPPMRAEIEEYNKKVENLEMCDVYPLYFNLTNEHMATDWAIEWLKVAENRRIAKDFEKKFSKCFIK